MKILPRLLFSLVAIYWLAVLYSGRQVKPIQKPVGTSQFKVLVGILTVPEKYDRRFLIRTLYGQMASEEAKLYFVLCTPSNQTMMDLVIAEKKMFADILILKCKENMDNGKTYTFFSSLPQLFNHGAFDFVMKTDDDVFLHLPNLVKKLKTLSKSGLYYGRIVNNYFMAGMGYVLSWDLVNWIATDSYPSQHRIGQEDALLASWLRQSGLLKHLITDDNAFYDYPDSGKGWAKPYIPETILIHRLKNTVDFISANIHFMHHMFSKKSLYDP